MNCTRNAQSRWANTRNAPKGRQVAKRDVLASPKIRSQAAELAPKKSKAANCPPKAFFFFTLSGKGWEGRGGQRDRDLWRKIYLSVMFDVRNKTKSSRSVSFHALSRSRFTLKHRSVRLGTSAWTFCAWEKHTLRTQGQSCPAGMCF